jgi:hypothetical protein
MYLIRKNRQCSFSETKFKLSFIKNTLAGSIFEKIQDVKFL